MDLSGQRRSRNRLLSQFKIAIAEAAPLDVDWKRIKLDDPLAAYLPLDPGDLIQAIKTTDPFSRDKIWPTKADLSAAGSVRDLFERLLEKYRANGCEIIVPERKPPKKWSPWDDLDHAIASSDVDGSIPAPHGEEHWYDPGRPSRDWEDAAPPPDESGAAFPDAADAPGEPDAERHSGPAPAASPGSYTPSPVNIEDPDTPREEAVIVDLHYATNRKATNNILPDKKYGRAFQKTLNYGRVEVSIPPVHEAGEYERPKWWKLEFRETAEKHIVLGALTTLEEDPFFASLRNRVQALENKTTFIFIHGYNVEFGDAARRAGQIAFDLFNIGNSEGKARLSAVPILFSWPSGGALKHYGSDLNKAANSQFCLADFINDVRERTGAASINIIAHSMGNRALVRALTQLAQDYAELCPFLDQIIMAAPDVDRVHFEQFSEKVLTTGTRLTLYASDSDFAMKMSKKVNGDPRAGDCKDGIFILDGMDSIDATDCGEDLLGHSYVGGEDVMDDIHELITANTPPSKRDNLVAMGQADTRHWRLTPDDGETGVLDRLGRLFDP
ncbi:MAG: alpha/beta hydrolase [Pseudomonadota bacterium]